VRLRPGQREDMITHVSSVMTPPDSLYSSWVESDSP